MWRARYESFGKTAVQEDVDGNGTPVVFNFRFPGQYFDAESGFYYNYSRDYDAAAGRYLQSDPIGLEGGLNTYAYAKSNPLRNIDPLGLYEFPSGAPTSCAVGDFECAAGIPKISPQEKEETECLFSCVLIGEGESAARDKGMEKYLEHAFGTGAKIVWTRINKFLGPPGWAWSIYSCNKECKKDCKS